MFVSPGPGQLLTPAPGWLSLSGAGSVWEQCQCHLRAEPAAEERLRRRPTPGDEHTDKRRVTGKAIVIENELQKTTSSTFF